MLNPFYGNQQPKVPDGTAGSSLGQRYVTTMGFQAGTVGPQYVVLYAGLLSGAVAFRNSVEDVSRNILKFTQVPDWDATINNLTLTCTQNETQRIVKWRQVSTGCKIMLTNNAEQNDGWWESIHVPFPENLDTVYTVPQDGFQFDVEKAMTNYVKPKLIDLNDNMAAHPSYQQGKLRNIHKVNFRCLPVGGNHDFINMNSNLNLPVFAHQANIGHQTNNSGTATAGNTIGKMFDRNFGITIIRLHGRSEASAPSKYQVTVASNQELIYDEDSPYASFHTRTPAEATVGAAHQHMANGQHASVGQELMILQNRLGHLAMDTSEEYMNVPDTPVAGVTHPRSVTLSDVGRPTKTSRPGWHAQGSPYPGIRTTLFK